MKSDRVTKLYAHLSNKERAVLELSHFASGNELEADRVLSSVPRKTYDCIDFEFRNWRDGIFHMAAMWAVSYWKLYTKCVGASLVSHLALRNGDTERLQEVDAEREQYYIRLHAVNAALDVVCREHGIDPDDMRKLTSTPQLAFSVPEILLDMEYQKEAEQYLRAFLPKDIR